MVQAALGLDKTLEELIRSRPWWGIAKTYGHTVEISPKKAPAAPGLKFVNDPDRDVRNPGKSGDLKIGIVYSPKSPP